MRCGYNTTHISRWGHRNLARLKTQFNVDFQMYLPSLEMVKDIKRSTLFRKGTMYWHVHCAQNTYPVQQSIKWKVPPQYGVVMKL